MDERSAGTTRDSFLGGRLILEQPIRGHRSGTDAVLLAAAAPANFDGLAYDVGAGTGAVGLALALRCPAAKVGLVERDGEALAMAARNVALNGLEARASPLGCDLLDGAARRAACPEPAALVLSNPPFFDPAASRPPPEPGRRAARVLERPIAEWIEACLDLLAPRGVLILINAVPALPAMLAALDRRAGGITLKPLLPRAAAPAKRVLLRARKSSRAPFALVAPLVLHEGDAFTAEADRVHRGEASIDW